MYTCKSKMFIGGPLLSSPKVCIVIQNKCMSTY